MESTVTAHCINPYMRNKYKTFTIDFPRVCPICGTAINAQVDSAAYIDGQSYSYANLFVTYFCNRCERCFVGNYVHNHYQHDHADLLELYPRDYLEEKPFSGIIKELSPDFCRIYKQAFEAEQCGYNELSGIGYRKSLEFLIKDYAIAQNEADKEKISKMLLLPCINEYIDNKRLRKLAIASAWIGNDETHYVRKHEEYSIDDLKLFINSAVSFIESDISSMLAEKLITESQST